MFKRVVVMEEVGMLEYIELLKEGWIGVDESAAGFEVTQGLSDVHLLVLDQVADDHSGTPTHSCKTVHQHIRELSLVLDEVHTLLKELCQVLLFVVETRNSQVETDVSVVLNASPLCHSEHCCDVGGEEGLDIAGRLDVAQVNCSQTLCRVDHQVHMVHPPPLVPQVVLHSIYYTR